MMGSALSVASITKIDGTFTHVKLPEVLMMNNSSVFKNAEFEAFVKLEWDLSPLKHPLPSSHQWAGPKNYNIQTLKTALRKAGERYQQIHQSFLHS